VNGLLQPNERLVCVGKTALRAPDGTPLEGVPQYMIVQADKADPAAVEALRENERLIVAGTVHTDHRAAEARFAALQAGREYQPPEDGTPLYIIEPAENVNRKTRLSAAEEKVSLSAQKSGNSRKDLRDK